MAQLRRDYEKYVELETEVIAIGPEGSRSFSGWWHKHKMPFIGIPDPEHVIAKGLYHQQFKLFSGGRMPALAVVDKEMKVRLMRYAELPNDIPSEKEILSLLEILNKENNKI